MKVIAVIGAGLIGKVTALCLAQRGFQVYLIDRSFEKISTATGQQFPNSGSEFGQFNQIHIDSRSYALHQSSLELLTEIGLFQQLTREDYEPVDRMWVQSTTDQSLPHTGISDFGSILGEAKIEFSAYQADQKQLTVIVLQASLENISRKMVLTHPQIICVPANLEKITWQTLILRNRPKGPAGGNFDSNPMTTGDEDTNSHLVHIKVDNKDHELPYFDAAIAADGAFSWIRGQLGITYHHQDVEQSALTLRLTCEIPHLGVAYQFFTRTGIVALLPLPNQSVSLVWSMSKRDAECWQIKDEKAVAKEVTLLSQGILGELQPYMAERFENVSSSASSKEMQLKTFPLMFRYANSLFQDSVFLVGDAAHVVHPFAGQGINIGFADVSCLMQSLQNFNNESGNVSQEMNFNVAEWGRRYALMRQVPIFIRVFGLQLLLTVMNRWSKFGTIGLSVLDRLPIVKRFLIQFANR